MITFALCDDEPSMLHELAARLSDFMEQKQFPFQILCFESGKAVLDSDMNFDILFLDIQMERPDGMETADLLRQRGFHGPLIFITVLKEWVFDSFEVQAFDYLVKPLDHNRFQKTLERALKVLEQSSSKHLIVQKGGASQVIPFSEIMYCEVISRKIYLHCNNGETIDYYQRLESLEQKLDGRFFRCHRSYLVNLDYVRGRHDGLVFLSDGRKLPLSRLREQEFTKALLIYMKERRR